MKKLISKILKAIAEELRLLQTEDLIIHHWREVR